MSDISTNRHVLARETARTLALSVEGALMQRLAEGDVDVERLKTSLLAVASGIAPTRRRLINCGMSKEFWQEVRRRWEADPRDGYAWLSKELNGKVSNTAIRKHAIEEGWAKA
ncbi:hypothetical protein [Halomonas sp. BC2]|uniref:hypothetical protein n=1 Tax=Halomonas sp. BC2 TaxID=1670449 RepID=UPI0009C1650C|nr:hypothetical protein [Halomonas sp. BC2]